MIAIAIAACFASAPVWANPTAPQVAKGSATFSQSGNLLTVTNSNGAIIDWNTFSIGANEATRFNQASAASSVLNRVVTNDPSVLLGALSSNGKVWLVNPAGIMVGQGARIDVAGFVASTLNIRNDDFLAGRLNFGATPSAGGIQNYGQISTPTGGSIYLVAPNIENHGIINAPNGEVLLAAGQTAQLIDTGTPGVKVDITGTEGNATNLGKIVAEAGRIGMAGVLVKNSGELNASSVVKEGGRIFLKASKTIALADSSVIAADGTKGGQIVAKVEDQGQLSGELLARGDFSAKGDRTTGSGGFVETSAKRVDVSAVRVDTGGGTWLLDPDDVEINSTSTISGATLVTPGIIQNALVNGNFAVQTNTGGSGGNGDIVVKGGVSWSSAYSLALTATRNLTVNAGTGIANSGTGGVTLVAGWDGTSPYSAPLATSGVGTLSVNSPLTTAGGNISLLAGQGISVSGGLVNILGSGGGNISLNTLGSGGVNIYSPSGTTYIAPGSGTLSVTAGSGGMNLPTTGGALSVTSSNGTSGFSVDKLNLAAGGGSLSFDGIATVGTLNMSGSSISNVSGMSTWNVTNAFNWSGGGLSGVGGTNYAVVNVNPSATLTVTATNSPYSNHGAVVNNSGTATLSGGTLNIGDGGSHFNNLSGATFTITDNSGFTGCGGCGAGQGFFNSGTLTKSGGTGVSIIGSGGGGYQEFNNTGTVNVNSGTLQIVTGGTDTGSYSIASGATLDLNAGSRTLNSGAGVSGTGILTLTGATLTSNTGSMLSLGGLTITGGMLQGSDDISVSGPFIWSGGTITSSGPGVANLNTSGTTTLNPSSSLSLAGTRAWNNSGTVNQSGAGYLYLNSGTPVVNNQAGGVWNENSTDPSYAIYYGTFNNAGTFNVSTGTQILSNTVFNNTATNTDAVMVTGGTLRLTAGGTDSGNYSLTSPGVLEFNAGTRTLNAPNITGTGTLLVSGGTVNVGTATTVPSSTKVTMTGGTLQGNADLTLQGAFNWSGGTITTTSSAANLNTSGTTTLNPSGSVLLTGSRTWNNSGTVNQSGAGYLYMNNGAPVVNNQAGATWNEASTNGNYAIYYGTFNNAGTFNVSTGTQILSNTAFNNTATNTDAVKVTGGTLRLTGNGTDSGNYVLTSPGVLDLNGGTRTLNAPNITGTGTLLLSGATVSVGVATTVPASTTVAMTFGTLQGTADLSLQGAFNWSGGTIQGSGNLNTAGTTTLNPSSYSSLWGTRVWNNTGTVNESGAGFLNMGSGTPTVNNQAGATWNEGATNTNYVMYYGTFNDYGMFNKTGTNTAQIYSTAFNNMATGGSNAVNVNAGTLQLNTSNAGSTDSGNYVIASGATLEFNGSSTVRNFAAGTAFSGNGTVLQSGGTVNVNAATIIPSALSYSMTGGTLQGTADLSLQGAFNWSGGTIAGSGNLNTSGTTTLNPSSYVYLNGTRTWNNTGTVNQSGAGYLNMGSGTPTVNNQAGATWNEGATNTNYVMYYGTFNDYGMFNKTGTNTAQIYSTAFNNMATGGSNAVNVNAGTLQLNTSNAGSTDSGNYVIASGATLEFNGSSTVRNFAAGTAFSGNGTVLQSGGTVNVNAATTIPSALSYSMTGGTLQGTADLSLQGAFNWSGGTIAGSGNLNTSGTTTLNPSSYVYLNGTRTWNNTGTVNQSGAGYLNMGSGTPTVNNQAGATWNEGSTNTNYVMYYGTFNDYGMFNKTGTNTAQIYSTAFINTATGGSNAVNVNAGTLQISSFAANTNSGTINLSSGATLSTNNTSLTNAAAGTIAGSGTLNLGAGNTLTNAGTLSPGTATSAGTLSITGNLINSGTIQTKIGGILAGAQYDVLAVSGTATLGGTLTSTLFNGFTPSGQSFDVITAGSASGSFATSNLPSGVNGAIVGSVYRLTHTGASCAGVCWDGGAATTNWTDAANWTGDALPGSTDVAYLNLVAGVTVNLANSSQSIKGLNSNANNHLVIGTGGTLTLNDSATTSTLAGNLSISGGTLTANGPLTLANLTQTSGTLSGTGAVSVGTFNWTGGTLTGAGAVAVSAALNMPAGTTSNAWNYTFLDGKTLTNNGVATLGSNQNMGGNGADLRLLNGATINNAGTWYINYANLNSTGSNTFNNTGTLTTGSLGYGGTINTSMTNNGTVNVFGDGLGLGNGASGNGAFVINTGATLANYGPSLSMGSLTQFGNLSGGGTLGISNALSYTSGTISTSFSSISINQSSGNLSVPALTASSSIALSAAAGNLTLAGGQSVSGGSLALSASGTIDNSGGAALMNAATLKVQSGGAASIIGNNQVGTLAANVSAGGFTFENRAAGGLTIGTVGATSGVTASGDIAIRQYQNGASNPGIVANQTVASSAGDVLLGIASGTGGITTNAPVSGNNSQVYTSDGAIALNGSLAANAVGGTITVTTNTPLGHTSGITGSGLISADNIDLQPSSYGPIGTSSAPLNTSVRSGSSTFAIGSGFPAAVYISHAGDANLGATLGSNATFNFSATGNVTVTSNISEATSDLAITSTGAGGMLTLNPEISLLGKNVTLTADRMALGSASSINAGTGTLWLKPKTAGWNIDLGSSSTDNAANTLELSAAEINSLSGTGTLRIGALAAGNLNLSGPLAPTGFSGALSLESGGTMTQASTADIISASNLAIKALGNITLDVAPNVVTNLAAQLGDATHQNSNFSFKNATALNIGSAIDGVTGISIALDANGFSPASPNGVIALNSVAGGLTQSAGALLAGKAVYASGTSVTMTQANPTGIIAGSATSGDFLFRSANPVLVSTVHGANGITVQGAANVTLNANSGGITLAQAINAGNGTIVLDAGGSGFTNTAGANPLVTSGRWLVYASDPASVSKGGMTSNFRHYGATYALYPNPGEIGNGFIYASTPSGALGVNTTLASGAASNTYGTAPTAIYGYAIPGLDLEDVSGSATFSPTITSATNVGNYTISYAGGLTGLPSFSGSSAANPVSYTLTAGTGLAYVVNPATLTVTPVSASLTGTVTKVYDGTTTAALVPANFLLSGFVNSDSASVTQTIGTYASKNVGSGILVSTSLAPGNFSPSGTTNLSNYTLPTSASGNIGVITPASVTVSGVTAQNKVYDATTAATITGTATLSGLFGSDVVTLGGTPSGSFADKNVGTAKPVSVTGLTLSGADAGNYTLSSTSASTKADITPASLTLSGLTAQNKVYDATTVATITGSATFSGVLGTDIVTLGGSPIASFADKNVGVAKPVTVSGLTLSGADAGNYTLSSTGASTKADITPANLTVSGLTAQNKVYDATTAATISGTATFSGVLGTDVVTLGGSPSGSFIDKNVGVAKAVSVTGLTLSGADAGNYMLTSTSAGTKADITPATLALSGVSAANKVYDGTTIASVSGGLAGVLGSDVVTAAGIGAFADKNVGTAKPVLASFSLTGTDAGNYVLSGATASTAADITIRPLSTWKGGASGNWSLASNWDALPDLSNVQAVSIPAGVNVTYDAGAGSTNLASLTAGGLNLAGGSLNIANSLTVSSSFGLSGGALALGSGAAVSLTQASGDLSVPAFNVASLSLIAPAGAISQSGAIVAASVNIQSQTGTTLNNAGNRIASFGAVNSGSGNISLINAIPLTITGITNLGGSISVENTGAVTTIGAISAPGGVVNSSEVSGVVSILAHSPLTIGAGGVSGGSVVLGAGNTPGSGDDLTLSGPVGSSGGPVTLTAGDNLMQSANVSTNGGAISATAQTGNIVLTSLNAGSGSITLNAANNIQSAPGYTGANLVGGNAIIHAGSSANLSAQVNQLSVTAGGTYAITNALTGTVVTPASNAAATAPTVSQVLSTVTSTTQQQPTQAATQTATPTPPPTTSSGPQLLSNAAQTIGGTEGTFGGTSGGADAKPTDSKSADKKDEKKQDETSTAKKDEGKPAVKKLPTCS